MCDRRKWPIRRHIDVAHFFGPMSGSGRSGHLLVAALPATARPAAIARMGGPTRRRIFGDRVRGAKISAVHAREQAKKAAREAAKCLLW
jgi:hypothetical protein